MLFATENETPLVSVCLLTYKHEAYIHKAIESVLEQETDFPCEFIIAEDCSPDNTRAIVKSYAERYPIKLILQEKNVGMQRNLKRLLDAPRGKYVAFFEGDDHWIDPLKLKKQVAVLEANEDIAVCYANAKIYDTQNPASNIYFSEKNKPPTLLDCHSVITSFSMPTCTVVFRNLIKPLPEWIYNVRGCDFTLVALAAKFGKAYYIDECLGLYLHDYTGLSRVIGQEHYLYDDALAWLNLYEHYDGNPAVWQSVVQKYIVSVDKLAHRGWPSKARKLFWSLPLYKAVRPKGTRPQLLKLFFKLHVPFFMVFRKTYLKKKTNQLKTVS